MTETIRIAKGSFLVALMSLAMGCVFAPREGYYDGEHHRYYHEGGWHDCGDHDEHCH